MTMISFVTQLFSFLCKRYNPNERIIIILVSSWENMIFSFQFLRVRFYRIRFRVFDAAPLFRCVWVTCCAKMCNKNIKLSFICQSQSKNVSWWSIYWEKETIFQQICAANIFWLDFNRFSKLNINKWILLLSHLFENRM